MMLPWHPHLDVWLLLGLPVVGYFWALARLGPQRAALGEPPATLRHKLCFISGVALLWIASDWPVHELSEQFLYSVHMVQHLLITLIAPPLLLLGMPPWLLRLLLRPAPVMAIARKITKPLPALIAFNAAVVLTHWPTLVDLTLRVEGLHFAAHLFLFVTALMMWTPVVGPLLELPRLSYPGRMFFLFLQSIIPTVPASFLTFAEKPIYKFYESAPRI
ncbi:MAG: cytochrome c oxidase assembly protein, partial [Acidimicrobiia bacterium]